MKKVAFICVHNSCRSQIAEALGKHLGKGIFESYSAGTETKPEINQDAVRLMKEIYNIDMEKEQYSKLYKDIPTPDILISMGCNVSCPVLDKKFYDNWQLEDPTGKSDEEFKKIISKIEENIKKLCIAIHYLEIKEKGIKIFNQFDDFISIYAKENITDAWYDDGVIIAQEILQLFDDEDWKLLNKELNFKSILWKQRLAYCLGNENNLNEFETLLKLVDTDDEELFELVIDSLRFFKTEKTRGFIKNNPQIIDKVNKLISTSNIVRKKVFEEFLKYNS